MIDLLNLEEATREIVGDLQMKLRAVYPEIPLELGSLQISF